MEFLSKDLKTFPKTNFYNETYHIGILMCCIESTFFILNINEISFTELVNNTQLDIVKIWQCFNDFLRFDIFMPTPLKFHLLDLEIKIISYYAWKNGSSLLKTMKTYLISEEIINSSNVSNEGESEKENKNKINFNINTTVSPAPNKINKKNILEHDVTI